MDELTRIKVQITMLEDVIARLLADAADTGRLNLDAAHQALVQTVTSAFQEAGIGANSYEAGAHECADRLFSVAKQLQRATKPSDRGI